MKMKKTFKFLTLTVLLSMVGVLSAFAEENLEGFTFTDDSQPVRYKVIQIIWGADNSGKSTGTVSVTSNNADRSISEVTIPGQFTKKLEGYYGNMHHADEITFTVTTVEAKAFENLTVANKLSIPGTVTTIEEGAFNGITNVTSLKIGSEEEPSQLTTLGDFVFGNTPIGELDLTYCPKLDFGNGTRPFLNAYGQENKFLTTVKLPEEIENIGVAFANCENLTSLNLGDTHVTELVDGALEHTGLTDVVLPYVPDKTVANVKIGSGAFAGSPVETLTINGPIAALDAIDADAFVNMPKLKKLVLGENADLKTPGAIPCYYKDGVAKGAFPNSPDLEEVIIGGKVSADGAIAPFAFKDKSKLKKIEFKQDIAKGGIGESAFENAGTAATELSITFTGNLLGANAIGKNAFKGTNKVKSLTFNGNIGIGAIGESAFEKTGSCAEVTFVGELLGAASIGKNAFAYSSISLLTFGGDIAAALYPGDGVYGGIAENAFYQMSKDSDCPATVSFNGELLGMKAVGEKAFYQAKIASLTFNEDIAAYSIAKDAFNSITGDAIVTFMKNLNGTGAIYETAFAKATLKSVEFKGNIKSGAIFGGATQTGAFHNAVIKEKLAFGTATSGGNIESDGIQDYAFEDLLGDAVIDFYGKLTGNNAIGASAFASSNAKKVTFHKSINYAAIEAKAFVNLNTRAGRAAAEGVFFKDDLIGENAIGSEAFYNANVAKIEFKNISGKSAICANAFENAGNSNNTATILIEGNVTGEKAINENAFLNAKAQSVEITGNVEADNAIYTAAFKGTNLKSLKIKGNIKGSPAIAQSAFEGNPLTTINLAWDETPKTISATADTYDNNHGYARRYDPVVVPIINNPDFPMSDSDDETCTDEDENPERVIMPDWWDIYQPNPAIDKNAFKNVKSDGETTLNLGSIKSACAIDGGAFDGAEIEVVNFNELMAPLAVANNQFSGATLKTVNFLKEFKKWEEVDADNAMLFGFNAFTNTKVSTVNFPKVSVKRAIAAPDLTSGPFYNNGADLILNFDYDVCTSAFGPNAFAGSNTVEINLKNEAVFEKFAFEAGAFTNIKPVTQVAGKYQVNINYLKPADNVNVYRAFAQKDFFENETTVDILFNTVPAVEEQYTIATNATDKTPYRVKFLCRKYIKMQPADGYFFGFFAPEDEQYIIEKYQPMGPDEPAELENGEVNPDAPTGATAGVYSAYYDDKTLTEVTEDDPSTPWDDTHFFDTYGGGQKYTADLYLNPLRVQDKGKYVLNQGHTFIVTSSSDADVVAYQDLEGRDGGVQTFSTLTPWQCNDLRWNPDKIWARYLCCGEKANPFFTYTGDNQSRFAYDSANDKFFISRDDDGNYNGNYALKPGHEWAGEMSYVAVQQGDIDFYGNLVRDYNIFVAMPDAERGVAFSNAPMIPADYAYVLVTDNMDKRIDYSGNNIYPTNEEDPFLQLIQRLQQTINSDGTITAPEYNGNVESWMQKVINLINAVGEKNGYIFRVNGESEEGSDHVSDEAHYNAIVAAFTTLFGNMTVNQVPVPETDEEGKVVLDEDGNPKQAYDENGDPIYKDVFDYENLAGDLKELNRLFKVVCDAKTAFELAKAAYDEANQITCNDEESEYQFDGTFSENEERLNEAIEAAEAELIDLSYAEDPDTGDDLYKQYLGVLSGDNAAADDLKEGLEGEAADAKELADAFEAFEEALEAIEDEHALAVFDNYKEFWVDAWTNGQSNTDLITTNAAPLRMADLSEDETEVVNAAKSALRDLWLATGRGETYDEVYSEDASQAAKDAYAEAKAAADDYAFAWYTLAVNAENSDATYQATYDKVKQNRETQEEIDALKAKLAALKALPCYGDEENPAEGTYLYAKQKLGHESVEAVEDDPTTDDVDETVEAQEGTGAAGDLEAARNAANEYYQGKFSEDVAKLIAAIKAVPEDLKYEVASPARLNIIWNDRPDEVVGIMEAVVNAKAAKTVNNDAIYNLNGMRVKNAGKGIYIQNGKKIIK